MRIAFVVSMLASLAVAVGPAWALDVETVPGSVERIVERVPGSPRSGAFLSVVTSADGRVIAATVEGPIQLPGLPFIPAAPRQVILIDRDAGTVELVSRTPAGGLQNGTPAFSDADWLSISADGRRVSFVSGATNLDPAAVALRAYTYVYDRITRQVRAIDIDAGLQPQTGMGQLDASGRRIVYFCTQTPTQPAIPGQFGLCIRDLETFVAERVYSGGDRTIRRAAPRFSGDGQTIYFGYSGPGLIGGWPNPGWGVLQPYLFDLPSRTLAQFPAPSPGQSGPTGLLDGYAMPISANADFVVSDFRRVHRRSTADVRTFPGWQVAGLQVSSAGGRIAFLWSDAGFGTRQLYVHDWGTAQNRFAGALPGRTPDARLCYTPVTIPGDLTLGAQQRVALSGDGLTLVFPSLASNLVDGDEPGSCDLFARSLDPVPFLADPQPVDGPNRAALAVLALLLALAAIVTTRRGA